MSGRIRHRRATERGLAAAIAVVTAALLGYVAARAAGHARDGATLVPWRDRPNLLVVTLCSLRADHVGAETTPRLEALAQEGVTFTRAWSNATFTVPAHAALLTGRLPANVAVLDVADTIPPDVPTLPEVLRLYGYRTLVWAPPEGGGDGGAGCAAGAATPSLASLRPGGGFERGVDRFLLGGVGDCLATVADTLARADGPWFATVHLKDAHAPYGLDRPDRAPADERLRAWSRRGTDGHAVADADARLVSALATDTALAHELDAAYSGAVHDADATLGRVLDALDAAGQLDDTLVVVAGDHGEALGEAGRFGHQGVLRPEVLRVPMVARLPGDRHAGERIDAPVSLVDVAATLLAAAGAMPPAGLDGRSLLPLLAGEVHARRPVFAQSEVLRDGAREVHDVVVRDGVLLDYTRGTGAWTMLKEGPAGWLPTTDAVTAGPLLDLRAAVEAGSRPPSRVALSPVERVALLRDGYW